MRNSVDYCIIVLFDYCIFYKDFTPKQVNRVHNRGKGSLKWEAKAKSRARRTTQTAVRYTKRFTHHIVKMAVVLFLCPTNRFPSGVSWQIKDEERKGNNELRSQWLWWAGVPVVLWKTKATLPNYPFFKSWNFDIYWCNFMTSCEAF